jgi:hypothetical protein
MPKLRKSKPRRGKASLVIHLSKPVHEELLASVQRSGLPSEIVIEQALREFFADPGVLDHIEALQAKLQRVEALCRRIERHISKK